MNNKIEELYNKIFDKAIQIANSSNHSDNISVYDDCISIFLSYNDTDSENTLYIDYKKKKVELCCGTDSGYECGSLYAKDIQNDVIKIAFLEFVLKVLNEL